MAVDLSFTVLLVRHAAHDEVGHVLSGRSDIALNATGRKQAQSLAARLSNAPIDKISTSPRRRARETANPIAERFNLAPTEVSALDEIDFGEWTGRTFADLEADARWRIWNAARGRATTPNGATMQTATSHAVRHLEARDDKGCTLCVSHCDIIRGLVVHYSEWSFDRLMSFDIDPASITTIEFTGSRGRVTAVNERVS